MLKFVVHCVFVGFDCRIFRRSVALFAIFTGMLLVSNWGQAQTAPLISQTWSDRLEGLETQPQAVRALWTSEMTLTHDLIQKLPQRNRIESVLRQRMAPIRTMQKLTLKNGTELDLIDQGLGKSIDLVENSADSHIRLASNFDISRKNNVRFESFSVSPDERYVVISSEHNGSINDVPLVIIDRQTKSQIANSLIADGEGKAKIKWIGPSAFWFVDSGGYYQKVDLSQSALPSKVPLVADGAYPLNLICQSNQVSFVDSNPLAFSTTPIPNLQCRSWLKILSADDQSFELLRRGNPDLDQLVIDKYSIVKSDDGQMSVQMASVAPADHQVFGQAYRFDGVDFITTTWGAEQYIWIVDSAKQTSFRLQIPSYASVQTLRDGIPGKTIKVTLETMISTDREFEYDWTKNSWVNGSPDEQTDLTSKVGLKYTNQVLQIRARDGVVLPVRLTYLSSCVVRSFRHPFSG